MSRLSRRFSNTRLRLPVRGRVLRPGCARSVRSDRGAFSIIGDVLGGVALFAVLFGVAIWS
jgi:hypothetical protein